MPRYHIPNLANACRLLRHVAARPESGTVAQLASELKIPRTTCLRIASTLVQEGFLAHASGGYLLGQALVALGEKAQAEPNLVATAQPFLDQLTVKTGETSHLAVWSEGRALISAVSESDQSLRATSTAGTLAHAHCSATGKVLLAYNFIDDLDRVIPRKSREKRTAATILTTAALRHELQEVLKAGFATDHEEYHAGVRCLAAPVRNASGKICAAIGITAATVRFSPEQVPRIARAVIAIANQLSAKLGQYAIR